jgi:serine/threonine-protein kinase
MIADFGAAYVIDWGVAKVDGETGDAQWLPSTSSPAAPDLTLDGEHLGTRSYMAPELTREGAKEADERTDVYSLGVILAELLMRRRLAPLLESGASVADALLEHAADRPPELVSACLRATAARDSRYASVSELLRDLEAYQHGDRDMELRRELSRQHTAEATRAFESPEGSEHERMRRAMSSVGRALALDPDNADAMRMLVSLLSHVPEEVPAEVEEAVQEKGREATIQAGRTAALLYPAVLAFTPLTLWMGILDWGLFIGAIVLALVATVMTGIAWPHQHRWTSPVRFPGFLSSTLLIALLSTVFGPFVLVPAFLAVNTMGHAFSWYHGKTWQGFLVAAPAILVPYLLQVAGVFPDTMIFEDGVIKIVPWSVDVAQPASELMLLAASLTLLASGLFVAARMRRNLEQALRRSQLHTWQLSQMLPQAPQSL